GGREWHQVLEDKHSPWVSEQSCAFGPNHRAYFISEASFVNQGEPNHHLGTTRLFVSEDGGDHWSETLRTGWADWSTSAVSSISGNLITFYQHSGDLDVDRTHASAVAALVFDADGKAVSGPYLSQDLQVGSYQGVYPFHAVSLDDGTVGALYFARREVGK